MNVIMKPINKYYSGWTKRPWVIVLHYTAGYTEDQTFKVLKKRGLSVHNTIERDGVVYEYVSDRNRALHAGYGRWCGVSNMNHNSLGIELVNFGWVDGESFNAPYGKYDWNKKNPEDSELFQNKLGKEWYRNERYINSKGQRKGVSVVTKQECLSFADHRDNLKDKLWATYTDSQINSTVELVSNWMVKHNILPENVIGHEHVSPDRKTDPGLAFPWKKFDRLVQDNALRRSPELYDETLFRRLRVKSVQSHCERMGLPVGDIDGYWGPKTQSAVELAYDKYGDFYGLSNFRITESNSSNISREFRAIPGFSPGRR